jgi:hypothetical protein
MRIVPGGDRGLKRNFVVLVIDREETVNSVVQNTEDLTFRGYPKPEYFNFFGDRDCTQE